MKKELPDKPTQEDIQQFLDARVEQERAALDARLEDRLSRPIPILDIEAGIPQPVRLQLAPIACWKCRQTMKAARGYIYDYNDEDQAFIALRQTNDTRQIVALIAHLRKADPAITPVGLNYSKTVGGNISAPAVALRRHLWRLPHD